MLRSSRTNRHLFRDIVLGRSCFSTTRLRKCEANTAPNLSDLDSKWAKRWREISPDNSLYPVSKINKDATDKKMIMSMFPYPSGMLHLGHLRVYVISDVLARFHRSRGSEVIHPMGWDAFGLPAENAAIERSIHPSVWTKNNIAKMKDQMQIMLSDFDWDREVTTCNPDYYKWTQKIFLMLFEEGLAYRKEAEINWDPVDKTVLANEQVDAEGKSWRSGAQVEKRLLSQWFLAITRYASDLNKDLDTLTEWPTKVKLMQKHWIGESHGVEVKFETNDPEVSLVAFTTRPDTMFSIQYIAISVDSALAKSLSERSSDLKKFIEDSNDLPDDSKAGFEITGLKGSNPLFEGQFDIPIFVAPYVLGSYGSGVVMGCPGHDERDFAFWKENRPNDSVVKTIRPTNPEKQKDPKDKPFVHQGILNVSNEDFNGLSSQQAVTKILNEYNDGESFKKTTQFKIRDWLISRQRYWGAPIPIIHCDSCGPVAVPEKDLPILLPEDAKLIGKGNPLENLDSFVNTECPSCGNAAKRDTDTMDTFMDSSWYYFRYIDPKNDEKIFDFKKVTDFMPVDVYVGGVEHAILHLLYARFISKFLAEKGLWDGSTVRGEPFKRLITQGMVHGKTYKDPTNERFLKPEELDLSDINNPKIISTGNTPLITYEKMSKSKYNGADPGECIAKYGADATRAHVLFQAPISDILYWDELKIVGVERWLRRLLLLAKDVPRIAKGISVPSELNENEIKFHNETETLFKSITESLGGISSLNTVISDYMKFTRAVGAAVEDEDVNNALILKSFKKLLVSMSVVTPATAEEAWESLLSALDEPWDTIFAQKWPKLETVRESNLTKYNVFFNGKMRFVHENDKRFHENEDNVRRTIEKLEESAKFLKGKTIKKIITKPKAISIVVS